MPQSILVTPGESLPACDPRLASLYRYWLGIRPAADLLPGRRHLEPEAIPQLLPWICLTDVQRAPLRFKYRLVGTRLVDVLGSDPSSGWYEEVHPDFPVSNAYPHFVAAVEQRRVAWYRGPATMFASARWKTIERLILPMAQNGRDVDMLLAITALDPAGGRDR